MGNELVKLDKAASKRLAIEEEKEQKAKAAKRKALATLHLDNVLRMAVENGAMEADPIWKKLVLFSYSWAGKRFFESGAMMKKPNVAIWDNNIVIYAKRDDVTGEFKKSQGFKIVGRILFAPGGGIAGVVVHDKFGFTMMAQGSLANAVSPTGWSAVTDDFYLIEDDPRLANGAVPNA
jgi:hypothetical protein